MCDEKELPKAEKLFKFNMDEIVSQITAQTSDDGVCKHVSQGILEATCAGIVVTKDDLDAHFANKSLANLDADTISKSLDYLNNNKFIEVDENNGDLSCTTLGAAVVAASLSPSIALMVCWLALCCLTWLHYCCDFSWSFRFMYAIVSCCRSRTLAASTVFVQLTSVANLVA